MKVRRILCVTANGEEVIHGRIRRIGPRDPDPGEETYEISEPGGDSFLLNGLDVLEVADADNGGAP